MGKPAQGHTAHQQQKGSGTQGCAAPKLFPRRCKDPPAQLCFLYKRSHWLLHPAGTPSLRADCVQVVRLQDAQAPRGLLLYPVSPGSSSPRSPGPLDTELPFSCALACPGAALGPGRPLLRLGSTTFPSRPLPGPRVPWYFPSPPPPLL